MFAWPSISGDIGAVAWAVGAMGVVIVLYDQLLFRPIVAWADKFRFEQTAAQAQPRSWVLRPAAPHPAAAAPIGLSGRLLRTSSAALSPAVSSDPRAAQVRNARVQAPRLGLDRAVVALAAWAAWKVVALCPRDAGLGATSGGGLLRLPDPAARHGADRPGQPDLGADRRLDRLAPGLAERVQPVAQFLAAFPANVLFPFVVVAIVRFHLDPDIWLSPLMVLGTQWYILFNVIAGRQRLPERPERGRDALQVKRLAVVAQRRPARHLPLLRHRRAHRLGRLVERQHRRRGGQLGHTKLEAHGLGRLHRQGHRRRRFPRVVLGMARDVGIRRRLQPVALAAAVCLADRRLRID